MAAAKHTQACVVVLYNHPTDPAAFERYYAATHVPLLEKHSAEIGVRRADLTKIVSALDGGRAPVYRKAVLWFDSMDALKRGIATPGFKALAGDLANFASGGVTALMGQET